MRLIFDTRNVLMGLNLVVQYKLPYLSYHENTQAPPTTRATPPQDLHTYETRHTSRPPCFLASASLTSNIPFDVDTNMHSPRFNPGTTPPSTFVGNPLANLASSAILAVIRRFGVLIALAFPRTGLPSQYLRPSHRRIVATLAFVTRTGGSETICSSVGG